MNLVINLGLKSIRGIVFDETGEQIYSRSFPVHTSLFKERVEQDAVEWLALLEKILSGIAEDTDLSDNIQWITATTSSSCIVGLNEKMQPETKVLMVSDKRALPQTNQILNGPYSKEKLAQSNLLCTPSSLIPKALWFKQNATSTFSKVKYWFGAGELINHFFTGEVFTDPLNATKAFYNETGYETDLIRSVGIDPDTLPIVVDIGTAFDIRPEIKEKYRLNFSCRFVLTTYDAVCAVIGSSTGSVTNACDVSGTVTSVRVLTNAIVKNDNPCLLTQPLNFLKRSLVGASNNLGGGIIEWFKQAYFRDDDSNVYFQMENYAQLSTIGSGGIIFLPFLLGERAPFIAPNASATFFGINRSSTIKDFTRAVFESTAYVTRDLMELVENAGVPVHSISVSGGLARFDTINQIKADVCNKPIHVIDNFESTSIGAYIIMALSNKSFSNFEEVVRKTVRIRKTIYPSEKNYRIYDQYFALYKQLNEKLMGAYETHKHILASKIAHENEIVRNL